MMIGQFESAVLLGVTVGVFAAIAFVVVVNLLLDAKSAFGWVRMFIRRAGARRLELDQRRKDRSAAFKRWVQSSRARKVDWKD
jgi:hypothetical protein